MSDHPTVTPTRWRKKPVEISAAQWSDLDLATPIIDWVLAEGGTARLREDPTAAGFHLAIDTLEGTMRAALGDWIIQGVHGEFYPCKPDIFEATYQSRSDALMASITEYGIREAIKDRDIALWLHAEVQHQLEELTAAKIEDGRLFLGVDIVERVVQASLNDAHGWGRDLENARARLRHVATICEAAASQRQALSRDSLIRALEDVWREVEPPAAIEEARADA